MNPQKITVLDINAQTEQTIENYLEAGYVIMHLAYLQTVNKLIIIYVEPFLEG